MPYPHRLRLPLILLLLGSASLVAQTVEIAGWQGNKSGAVSLTFDDALPGHWSHAAPIMTGAGVRGTFFVITGSVDWDGARAAAVAGHEIGSHSTVDATLQNDANADLKMQQSHDAIETQIGTAIPGYQCHTIAWPYGYRRLDVINDPAYHGLYLAARNAGNALGASNSYNSATTSTWWKYGEGSYGLDHFFVVGDALMFTATSQSAFENQLDLASTQGAWTVFTYHGIETGGYQNISSENFTDQVNAVAARSDLYVAPFGEVIRYIRERDAASASVASNDGTTIVVTLTDSLVDSVFNIPLTLLVDAPSGWTSAEVVQNAQNLEATIADGKIQFDAIPDAGEITITQVGGTPVVVPVLTISPLSPTTVQLSWETVAGLQYEVKESTNLSSWSSLDPAIIVNGTGSTVQQNVPNPSMPRFYQLSITVAP